jgi:hypothetical protein
MRGTQGRLRRRARLQLVFAIAFAVLMVAAIAVPIWIEEVGGLSPDGGNGELELLLALPFGLASIACGALTWRSRRELSMDPGSAGRPD